MRPLAIVIALLIACGARDDLHDREIAIERELLAPCCWRENLEDHDSDIAQRLRAEIHARLVAGDTDAAIEASLRARYGERMHVRPESSLVGAAAVVAGIVALALLSRLRRRAASTAPTIRLDDEDTSYGDRLDDELAAID